jgi:4-hydroxybenzoate polyprenyltransferase
MNSALRTALRLGRVSNLPTVWTNVLAGIALNGGDPLGARTWPLAVAMSSLYVGGMYLNDAFDHRWDAQHRPERPIPSGQASARTVFLAGFGFIGLGLAIVGIAGTDRALLSATALAGLIVLYDVSHKGNPLAPLVMGLCRVGVYLTAGVAVAATVSSGLLLGAGALLAYLVLLTALARNEHRHPGIPRLIGRLIAGISLLDALLIALAGRFPAALLAAAAFLVTRRMQRRIAGT